MNHKMSLSKVWCECRRTIQLEVVFTRGRIVCLESESKLNEIDPFHPCLSLSSWF